MSDANSQPRPISQNRDKPNATGDSSSQKQAETPESRNEIGNSASTKSTANSNARTKPKSIGHYIIGKTIGEGTFGKVKVATHILTGEKVAIKVLEKSKIADVSDVERVAREIHILKLIRHPNIIQLYEIIETPKQLFLVMEFANGGELFDYIVANTRVKEREASKFFQEIIGGVEYIHKLNIVHRDLKPENLLLDQNKKIKVVDFGLSNTYKNGELLKTACGSPCYAAPEMIAGKKYQGLNVDIWSCGVILFALVCGYLPFEDPNTSQLYKKILNGDYTIPKFVSGECRDLIKNILNTDPVRRFTMEDIRRHPWFTQCKQHKEPQGIIVGLHKIPIDYDILKQLEQFDLNLDYTEKCIEANKHNHVTTSYYLLLKKHLRSGGKSPADFNSDNFDSSLLLQTASKRVRALKNNFTGDAEVNASSTNKKPPLTAASGRNGNQQITPQSDKETDPSDKESIRSQSNIEPEQQPRASSVKGRRYIEAKRAGSTGGSSSREQELAMLNSSAHQQVSASNASNAGNSGSRFIAKNGIVYHAPQNREQSAENNSRKVLPSVRNQSREGRDLSVGSQDSSINSDRTAPPNGNTPSSRREIQTPTHGIIRPQNYRVQASRGRNPNFPPHRMNMVNKSINREVLQEKLANIVVKNPEYQGRHRPNNFVEESLSSISPKNSKRQNNQDISAINALNDSLKSDDRSSANNTINYGGGASIRSTPKNDDSDSLILDNLNNSKDLTKLNESTNSSYADRRRPRGAHTNTLNNSYITHALNTSLQRVKPQSQSPNRGAQLYYAPKEPYVTKPSTSTQGPGYRAKMYINRQNKIRVVTNDNRGPNKPTTASGIREFRGRSVGMGEERKRIVIPSYDSSANNSNNTSLLNNSYVVQPRVREERNKPAHGHNISFDQAAPSKTGGFQANPNLTMYYPELKSKKQKLVDFRGNTFYGSNMNGFNGRKVVLK